MNDHPEDDLDDAIAALRARRVDAMELLLAAHGREIQGVAFLILADREAAEDVLMDTLITAWEHGPSLRDDAALRPWLLRIAANRSLSVRRRAKRLRPLDATDDPVDVHPSEADVVTRLMLLEVVGELPVRMRAAVVLHYYAGMTVDDVADAVGRSRNTVKSQLGEALSRMRTRLDATDQATGRR